MPTAPTGSSASGGFTPPTIEELHALLPQYEISAILGLGGMGAVYKGRQTKLARDVAIKILPADATGSESDEAFNFAERFQREAQAMARLHHQRIIAVHDYGETIREDGKPVLYIVMEFVAGTDLNHLIKSGALNPDQSLAVITQICDALNYAHEQGIVHRDIKPANIMLDVEGNVKIADFGLAKLTGGDAAAQAQLTMTNMAMGTPDYVSPEQLEQGREVDNRADIYSLGVMIYEMLTGAVPRGAFLPPSKKATGDLDPRLDEVVTKAMQADPDTRYQQVSQLWTDVDKIRTTPRPVAGAAPKLMTGRVPVISGGTGGVKILTGDTGKVPARPASTKLPIKEPMDPAKKKKLITTILVSIGSLILLAALAALVLAPSASKNQDLATATAPTTEPEPPRTSSSQDEGVPDSPGFQPEGPKTPDVSKAPSKGAVVASRRDATKTPDAPGDQIDLLSLLDPSQDTLTGNWTRTGDELTSGIPMGGMHRLAIPIRPSGSYRLSASFTRTVGGGAIMLHLPLGEGRETTCVFDHKSPILSNVSGIEWIDGETIFSNKNPSRRLDPPLEQGRRYTADVDVVFTGNDRVAIDVLLDSEPFTKFEGALSRLSIYDQFSQGDKADLPGLLVAGSTCTFHDLSLTPLDGGALEPLRFLDSILTQDEGAAGASRPGPRVPATPSTTSTPPPDATNTSPPEFTGPIDLLAAIELPRDVLNGSWSRVGGAVVRETSDSRQGALLALPVEAPDSYTLRASFTAINVSESTNLLLPVGDRHVELNLGGFAGSPGGPLSGLSNINEKSANTNATAVTGHALEKDRTYALEARVALNGNEAGIEIDLDGDELIRWTGPVASLSLSPAPFISKALTMGPLVFLRHPDTGEKSAARWESAALIPGAIKPPPTLTTSETKAGQKIAALLSDYSRKFNTALGDAYNEGIAALNTSYAGALERAEKSIAASGNLDALLLYRNEIEAAKTAGNAPIASPLPANTPAALVTMRETYTTTVTQREQKRDADAKPLLLQFDRALDDLQRTFTQQQKIEDALEVRQARDHLKEIGVSLFTGAASIQTGAWNSLFNGRDLDGWTVRGDANTFQVKDGAILVTGSQAYLYYTGKAAAGALTEYELKAQVMTRNGANSGFITHISMGTDASFPKGGSEIQINNGAADSNKTGSILPGKPVNPSPAQDDEWFELGFTVQGNTVTTTVNGDTITTQTDPSRLLNPGTIAIQQWTPSSGTTFLKDIKIRPLSSN